MILPLVGMSASQMVTLVAVIGSCAILLISARRRVARYRGSPRAYAREQIRQIKEERKVSREVRDVMSQLEELARQMQAQIDTRVAKLEAVTRAADGRIATLERLVHEESSPPRAERLVATDAEEPPASRPARHAGRCRLVQHLAGAGLSSVEIAHRTGIPTGEVELIRAVQSESGISC